jgi:hypothetical protein
MRSTFLIALAALVTTLSVPALRSTIVSPCAPPHGFKDTPHPSLAPDAQLVSHTEEVIVNRPLDQVLNEVEHTALNQAIRPSSGLPGVIGTYALTSTPFGQPGSRRLVCLSDGSTTEEQVLANERSKTSAHFRYIVWNYTTPKARPIVYGLGDFLRTDLGNGRTRTRWTYFFQLNRCRFPGFLGPLGDYLFRVTFLERDYAKMMKQTLAEE